MPFGLIFSDKRAPNCAPPITPIPIKTAFVHSCQKVPCIMCTTVPASATTARILLGQKAILNALSENGYADVAYKVASQRTYPSWGWWMENGATTLYENWKIDAKSDISLNHIMFGEIGAWLYKALSGIKPDPLQPGFKNVILEPHFVDGLDHFEASHTGPYGKIVSDWTRDGKSVIYNVTINGLQAYLNGKVAVDNSIQLQSGRYEFKWK